jgi:hypothetical protein
MDGLDSQALLDSQRGQRAIGSHVVGLQLLDPRQ